MIRELDTVVLTHDIDKYGLKEGDIGAIVHCYSDGNAFEVEFVTAEGRTIAVFTLTSSDIRLMSNKEILHVREIAGRAA
ncbi:MAG TPA: DUF4926 domain-containing protein [Thermodesulfovibrionales bacterium]|nr:DUF4926 domain-containing protein [Thermodesulfovibrionales bacterium]